jgi:hypothetical protein
MGVYESASAGGIPLHKRARLLRIIHVPTSKPNDSAIFVRAWLGSRATRTIPAMTDVHHKIAHKGGAPVLQLRVRFKPLLAALRR